MKIRKFSTSRKKHKTYIHRNKMISARGTGILIYHTWDNVTTLLTYVPQQFCPRRVILATGEIIKYEAGRKS